MKWCCYVTEGDSCVFCCETHNNGCVGRVCKVHTIGTGAVGGVGDVVRSAGGLEQLVVILRRETVL